MKDDIFTTGIVISAMSIGEYDKRVVLLTKELGKIHAFARGARRQNSSLMAPTQPFTFGKFVLREGRDAYSLVSAMPENYFLELRNDITMLYYGYYFLEAADYFGQDGLDETELLKLLYVSFKALSSGNKALDMRLIRRVFEWRILSIEGYVGAELPKEDKGTVSDTTEYTLKFISETKIERLYTFTVTDEVLEELSEYVESCRRKYMPGPFKSLEMI